MINTHQELRQLKRDPRLTLILSLIRIRRKRGSDQRRNCQQRLVEVDQEAEVAREAVGEVEEAEEESSNRTFPERRLLQRSRVSSLEQAKGVGGMDGGD